MDNIHWTCVIHIVYPKLHRSLFYGSMDLGEQQDKVESNLTSKKSIRKFVAGGAEILIKYDQLSRLHHPAASPPSHAHV